MADLESIKSFIGELAGRPNNVTLDEIEWVVNQLGDNHGYTVKCRQTRHCLLFRVGDQRFGVNVHNPGNRQVKRYSVKDFLNAMIELELFEG
jgi:hypothetical protein